MKRFFKFLLIFLVSATLAVSCNKEESEESKVSYEEQQRRQANLKSLKYLKDEIMSDYYYWNDQMGKVGYNYNTDIYEYFDALLYKKDRWSWMIDGPSYIDSEAGVMTGTYGISIGQMVDHYKDYGIYIKYVYPGSPFDLAGIKRGWLITKIDKEETDEFIRRDYDGFIDVFNNPGTTKPHLFTFHDPEGNTVEMNIVAAETLNTRPALAVKIFTADDYPGLPEPVGYFNYLSFKADEDINDKSMLDDITEPMDYFKKNNIKTLIVDLRYNGGGDSRASNLLASYLAPASARGKVYVNRVHNEYLRSMDKATTVDSPAQAIKALEASGIKLSCKPDSPEFEHLYFITGSGSASASEMVLNGLEPLADVHHVGNTTYGKPNGMYVFLYPEHLAAYDKDDYSGLKYVFLPICFYNKNGEGREIPDTGIVPENKRPDDLYHDFDPSEDNIGACLYHIVHGSFPDIPEAAPATKAVGGIDAHLNEWENDRNWGRYTVKPDFL